ncbi:hypothetical protein AAFF_G00081480 [Aldrovandia affinis]|uniref:Uncharacterized protein n=1 Tax=Aldrovandia affinis TaxID=143900 RepID=A0AAD7T3E7_9TELE|nr:hypothetical protein AAFF_G00081480 [Aldrovandia affinis]
MRDSGVVPPGSSVLHLCVQRWRRAQRPRVGLLLDKAGKGQIALHARPPVRPCIRDSKAALPSFAVGQPARIGCHVCTVGALGGCHIGAFHRHAGMRSAVTCATSGMLKLWAEQSLAPLATAASFSGVTAGREADLSISAVRLNPAST